MTNPIATFDTPRSNNPASIESLYTPQASIESLFYKMNNSDRKDILNKLISTFVNGASTGDLKELATDMSHDHRTLVQDKFRFILNFCQVLASNHKAGNYDARNEYACETSAKIMDMVNGVVGVPRI